MGNWIELNFIGLNRIVKIPNSWSNLSCFEILLSQIAIIERFSYCCGDTLLIHLFLLVRFDNKGAVNNYVDRLPFLTTLRGHFLYPQRKQKQTCFDPFLPHLVHLVIEWPLRQCSQCYELLTILGNAKHFFFK